MLVRNLSRYAENIYLVQKDYYSRNEFSHIESLILIYFWDNFWITATSSVQINIHKFQRLNKMVLMVKVVASKVID
jgi:hypothetical protein